MVVYLNHAIGCPAALVQCGNSPQIRPRLPVIIFIPYDHRYSYLEAIKSAVGAKTAHMLIYIDGFPPRDNMVLKE